MTMRRREFLRGIGRVSVQVGSAALLLACVQGVRLSSVPVFHGAPAGSQALRPPGALPDPAFLTRCIRCQKCAQACEADAILCFGSGPLEGTPYILPERRACTLCMACGPACPTGALEPLAHRTLARMGVAHVDTQLCVSHNGTGICGACYTACPLRGHAIRMTAHNAPRVDPGQCVGCGLCEEVCIVKRDKAIRVRSGRELA